MLLSLLEKGCLTVRTAGLAFLNPNRSGKSIDFCDLIVSLGYELDMVAKLGEITGESSCIRMLQKMKLDPIGRQILNERPIICSLKYPQDLLNALPLDTFGHAYAQFMKSNGLDADAREPVTIGWDLI
jgi:ubiquinone biosynthesis protein COQ4